MLIQALALEQSLALSLLPIGISFILGFFDPFIQHFWESRIKQYANEDDRNFNQKVSDNYVDFARKATTSVRIYTAFCLTFIGSVIRIFVSQDSSIWGFLLIGGVAIYLMYKIERTDPHELATNKIGPYYRGAVFTMGLNLALIAYILVLEFI